VRLPAESFESPVFALGDIVQRDVYREVASGAIDPGLDLCAVLQCLKQFVAHRTGGTVYNYVVKALLPTGHHRCCRRRFGAVSTSFAFSEREEMSVYLNFLSRDSTKRACARESVLHDRCGPLAARRESSRFTRCFEGPVAGHALPLY